MRLTPNNIAIRRRKISCSTQLLPTIVNHIVNKFPASEAAVTPKSMAVWKTQRNIGLLKTCANIQTSPTFTSLTPLLYSPTFTSIQKRYLSSGMATVGGNPLSPPDFSETIIEPTSTAQQPSPSKNFTYFVVGATGVLGGMAAKSTAMNFLSSLSASGDVLALAQVEVDLNAIPEGKSVVLKWRGKPVFIRHRTPEEIEAANSVDVSQLRDPQTDSERTKKPEWIIMMGVCTHLGCVPVADSGDYGGWYCPCQ